MKKPGVAGAPGARDKYTVLGDLDGAEPWQLYDLEADPCELNNLVNDPAYETVAATHHLALRERLIQTTDPYPLKAAFGCEALNVF